METEDIIQYITLLLKGAATAEQERDIWQWLEKSEEHQQLYREACEVYYKLNYAENWQKIDVDGAIHKIRVDIGRKTFAVRWGYRLAGIAAVLLICLSTFMLMYQLESTETIPALVENIKSGQKKAILTLADGRKVELDSKKVVMDLGRVTAEGDSLSGLVYHKVKDSVEIDPEYNTLSVPRGGEYILTLSDGTKVWLNSETELRYPVVFAQNSRSVYVTGEAYFDVVKDQDHPFIVNTLTTQTIVHGTSFNVMAYRKEMNTEITLVQGSVTVQVGEKSCHIRPGQQVRVDNSSREMEQYEVNVNSYISWKDGLFDFEGMTLEDLVVKLGRWYDVNFFFVNSVTGAKKFTGAVKRNNTLQFMLDFVEKTSNVRFEVKGNTVRVYSR